MVSYEEYLRRKRERAQGSQPSKEEEQTIEQVVQEETGFVSATKQEEAIDTSLFQKLSSFGSSYFRGTTQEELEDIKGDNELVWAIAEWVASSSKTFIEWGKDIKKGTEQISWAIQSWLTNLSISSWLLSEEQWERVNNRLWLSGDETFTGWTKEIFKGTIWSTAWALEFITTPVSAPVWLAIEEAAKGSDTMQDVLEFAAEAEKGIGNEMFQNLWYDKDEFDEQDSSNLFGLVLDAATLWIWGKIIKSFWKTKSIDNAVEDSVKEITPIKDNTTSAISEIKKALEERRYNPDEVVKILERNGVDTYNINRRIEKQSSEFIRPIRKEIDDTYRLINDEYNIKDLESAKSRADIVNKIAKEKNLDKRSVRIALNKVKTDKTIKNKPEVELRNILRNAAIRGDKTIKWQPVSQASSLTYMEDNWYVKRTELDDTYSFKFTEKGNELLTKLWEDVELLKDWIKYWNKRAYDDVYNSMSVNVSDDAFRKNIYKTLKEDLNAWGKEIKDFKDLLLQKEINSKADVDYDIYVAAQNIQNKYGIDGSKIIDPIDWTVNMAEAREMIKKVNLAKQNEFLNIRQLDKKLKKSRTLKTYLSIEDKIYSKIFKEWDKAWAKRTRVELTSKYKAEIAKNKAIFKEKWESYRRKYEEKISVLKHNYETKLLELNSVIEGKKALRIFYENKAREIAKNIPAFNLKSVNSAMLKSWLVESKTPKQMKAISEKIKKEIQVERYRAIKRQINEELKNFTPSRLWGKVAEKYNRQQAELIAWARALYTRIIREWDASPDVLEVFLRRIKEVKEWGKIELERKRFTQQSVSAKKIDQIRKEGWVVKLSNEIRAEAGKRPSVFKRLGVKFSAAKNELNFYTRILEKLWSLSDTFYKEFLIKTDIAYNKYLSYQLNTIEPLIKKIEDIEPSFEKRVELGQFLTSFRRRTRNDGSTNYIWLDKIIWDWTSLFHIDWKASRDVPAWLEWINNDKWKEIRDTKLGEMLEEGVKNKKWRKLKSDIHKEFNSLKDEVDEVSILYDNKKSWQDIDYFPLSVKEKWVGSQMWGFDDITNKPWRIGDSFNEDVTDSDNVYNWDVASVLQRWLSNEKYYAELRPQYENLLDLWKWPKDYKTDKRSGWLELDVDDVQTKKYLELYIDRIRSNWDEFSTTSRMINQAINYVNTQYLWFNPWTIIKQTLSWLDAVWTVWTRNLSSATFSKLSKEAKKQSAVLANRAGGEISLAELEQLEWGKIGKWYKKFNRVAMKGVQVMDEAVASRVWLWAYAKALQNMWLIKQWDTLHFNFPDKIKDEAIARADIDMQKIMSTANPLLLPPAYRSSFGRVMLQLFTTQLNRLGILFKDMPDQFRKWEYKRAALTTTWWIASSIWDKVITAALWYYGYQLWIYTWDWYDRDLMEILLWEDEEERNKKVTEYLMSELWIWFINDWLSGDDITVVWWFVSRIFKDIKKASEAEDSEEMFDAMLKTWADFTGTWVGKRAYDFYQNTQ